MDFSSGITTVNSDVDFLRLGLSRGSFSTAHLNAQTLMELADCDVGVVPTQFQRQQFPDQLTSRLVVAHEGVDVDGLSPFV